MSGNGGTSGGGVGLALVHADRCVNCERAGLSGFEWVEAIGLSPLGSSYVGGLPTRCGDQRGDRPDSSMRTPPEQRPLAETPQTLVDDHGRSQFNASRGP